MKLGGRGSWIVLVGRIIQTSQTESRLFSARPQTCGRAKGTIE